MRCPRQEVTACRPSILAVMSAASEQSRGRRLPELHSCTLQPETGDCRLQFRSLPHNGASDADLRAKLKEIFDPFGKVEEVVLRRDRSRPSQPGSTDVWGYIRFSSPLSKQEAICTWNLHKIRNAQNQWKSDGSTAESPFKFWKMKKDPDGTHSKQVQWLQLGEKQKKEDEGNGERTYQPGFSGEQGTHWAHCSPEQRQDLPVSHFVCYTVPYTPYVHCQWGLQAAQGGEECSVQSLPSGLPLTPVPDCRPASDSDWDCERGETTGNLQDKRPEEQMQPAEHVSVCDGERDEQQDQIPSLIEAIKAEVEDLEGSKRQRIMVSLDELGKEIEQAQKRTKRCRGRVQCASAHLAKLLALSNTNVTENCQRLLLRFAGILESLGITPLKVAIYTSTAEPEADFYFMRKTIEDKVGHSSCHTYDSLVELENDWRSNSFAFIHVLEPRKVESVHQKSDIVDIIQRCARGHEYVFFSVRLPDGALESLRGKVKVCHPAYATEVTQFYQELMLRGCVDDATIKEVIATASMFGPRGTSSCFDSASGRSMQLQRVTFGRMVFEYTAGPQYSQRTSTSRCDFTRCLKRCKRLARSRGAIRVAILAPTAADDEEDPRAIRQEIRSIQQAVGETNCKVYRTADKLAEAWIAHEFDFIHISDHNKAPGLGVELEHLGRGSNIANIIADSAWGHEIVFMSTCKVPDHFVERVQPHVKGVIYWSGLVDGGDAAVFAEHYYQKQLQSRCIDVSTCYDAERQWTNPPASSSPRARSLLGQVLAGRLACPYKLATKSRQHRCHRWWEFCALLVLVLLWFYRYAAMPDAWQLTDSSWHEQPNPLVAAAAYACIGGYKDHKEIVRMLGNESGEHNANFSSLSPQELEYSRKAVEEAYCTLKEPLPTQPFYLVSQVDINWLGHIRRKLLLHIERILYVPAAWTDWRQTKLILHLLLKMAYSSSKYGHLSDLSGWNSCIEMVYVLLGHVEKSIGLDARTLARYHTIVKVQILGQWHMANARERGKEIDAILCRVPEEDRDTPEYVSMLDMLVRTLLWVDPEEALRVSHRALSHHSVNLARHNVSWDDYLHCSRLSRHGVLLKLAGMLDTAAQEYLQSSGCSHSEFFGIKNHFGWLPREVPATIVVQTMGDITEVEDENLGEIRAWMLIQALEPPGPKEQDWSSGVADVLAMNVMTQAAAIRMQLIQGPHGVESNLITLLTMYNIQTWTRLQAFMKALCYAHETISLEGLASMIPLH